MILLQWGHGVEAVETPPTHQPMLEALALQWGHGVEAVETSKRAQQNPPLQFGLQWGHGVEAVETPQLFPTVVIESRSFNGATA